MAKNKVNPWNAIKWIVLFVLCVLSYIFVWPLTDTADPEDSAQVKKGSIRLGLDLKGGTAFELGVDNEALINDIYAQHPDAYSVTNAAGKAVRDNVKLNAALQERLKDCDSRIEAVVRSRVDAMGTNEPVIQNQNREETVHGIKRPVHGLLVQLPGVDKATRDRARSSLESMVSLEFRLACPSEEEAEILADIKNSGKSPEGYRLRDGGVGYERTADYPALASQPGYFERLHRFGLWDSRWQFMLMPVRSADPLNPGKLKVDYYVPRIISSVPGKVTGNDFVSARAKPTEGLGKRGYEVAFKFNAKGGEEFRKITSENIGRQLAIILDGQLISSPVIQAVISTDGVITGDFTWEEAHNLAVNLNAGALPAPLKVNSESMVAPTIGDKAIHSGVQAAIFGFLLVAAFMVVYYWYAGLVANVALILDVVLLPVSLVLVSNLLGVFGGSSGAAVKSSGFDTVLPVLTMPGIAGLVLTLGMAVDANVLVFERIREEFQRGHNVGESVASGYARAFTAILDSNLTTIIIGVILFVVGTGPVRGFAIMLTSGVIVSMFTAVVVTHMVFDATVKPESVKPFRMLQFFKNPHFDFMKYGTATVIGSAVVIIASLAVFFIRLNNNPSAVLAVDLCGGTSITYDVAPDSTRPTEDEVLAAFKTFDPMMIAQFRTSLVGSTNVTLQVKTSETSETVGAVAGKSAFQEDVRKLGLADRLGLDGKGNARSVDVPLYVTSILEKSFPSLRLSNPSTAEVGSVVGDDLKKSGTYAVVLSLLAILIYVGFRFKFGFGIGGIVALAHDALISFGLFTLCGRQVSLIVVTAILTIIGYSINDTVVVFDRIREQLKHDQRSSFRVICNKAINDCLGRTVITSVTTFFAVLALFLFADGSIYDFALTMLIGVIAGTYSSVFIATPVMTWCYRGKRPDFTEEKDEEKQA